jgi:hypothetical protein
MIRYEYRSRDRKKLGIKNAAFSEEYSNVPKYSEQLST